MFYDLVAYHVLVCNSFARVCSPNVGVAFSIHLLSIIIAMGSLHFQRVRDCPSNRKLLAAPNKDSMCIRLSKGDFTICCL